MALTEQQKQKKAKQKKLKRSTNTSMHSNQKLQDKITPFLEHPFYECLIPHNLFDAGIGNILITRLSPKGEIIVCSFIIDVFCLGIKKTLVKIIPLPEYESTFKPKIIESHGGYTFSKIKPACAKKLIEGAELYAHELGFSVDKDYPAVKAIFGEEKLGRCWSRYRYGRDKMPYYVKGPNESSIDANKIIATLEKSCGTGNFHYHL